MIKSLIVKSKNGTFGENDYATIYELLESKIYDKNDYQLVFEKVKEQEALINEMILQIFSYQEEWNWNFKMFKL